MKFVLLVLASVLCVSLAHTTTVDDNLLQFVDWMRTFEKSIPQQSFYRRFNVFKQNLHYIRTQNQKNNSFTLALNEFAAETPEEFRTRLGYRHIEAPFAFNKLVDSSIHKHHKVAAGGAVDWRTQNAVTPVKNQGQCGSCWAFSATGGIEGRVAVATGTLTSLSEQELVDCSQAQGNEGCNGGLMNQGFEYVIGNKGLSTESDYPYTAQDGTCHASGNNHVSPISSYSNIKVGSEADLLTAVTAGPVSIAIEADQMAFQFYSKGVFDAQCGQNLDHGVLVVGYGTDSGKDYWTVKNSWGAAWGESGYIRLVRGKNQCGLTNAASYPVV